MLFEQLAQLVANGITLSLTVAKATEGKIEVTVVPSAETGKSGFNLVPKTFTATPAEFDAEFAEIMRGYAQTNISLKDQLAAVDAVAAQTAKEASDAAVGATKPATKALTGPRGTAKSSPRDSSPKLLSGPSGSSPAPDAEEQDDEQDEGDGKEQPNGAQGGEPAAGTNAELQFSL